jgi:hypothetical protein
LTLVANEKKTDNFFLQVSSLILFAKFAAGVVDTGGNLPPVALTPAENLLPVS